MHLPTAYRTRRRHQTWEPHSIPTTTQSENLLNVPDQKQNQGTCPAHVRSTKGAAHGYHTESKQTPHIRVLYMTKSATKKWPDTPRAEDSRPILPTKQSLTGSDTIIDPTSMGVSFSRKEGWLAPMPHLVTRSRSKSLFVMPQRGDSEVLCGSPCTRNHRKRAVQHVIVPGIRKNTNDTGYMYPSCTAEITTTTAMHITRSNNISQVNYRAGFTLSMFYTLS